MKSARSSSGETRPHHLLGRRSRRRPSRRSSSPSSSSRATSASGSTAKSSAPTADRKKLRLGARVQVIQDRITISDENRARLVEALETALRFGKDRINFIDLETKEAHPFSTGWHCAHCDLDIRPPTPGLFSFNNPLGACPDMPRLRPHHRGRFQSRHSRSRAFASPRARSAFFAARRWANRKRICSAPAPGRRSTSTCPSRNCRSATRIASSTARKARANTARKITRAIVGTACGDFSNGSRARPTRCTCACCSAAIAPTPVARAATAAATSRRRSIIARQAGRRRLYPAGICRAPDHARRANFSPA